MDDWDDQFDTWWDRIEPGLGYAKEEVMKKLAMLQLDAELLTEAYIKARAGWKEHGGDIVAMSSSALEQEIDAELLDAIVYQAAQMLVEGEPNLYEVE
jgi:hypothetical protein